jgi:hypothetical protein
MRMDCATGKDHGRIGIIALGAAEGAREMFIQRCLESLLST